MEVAKIKITGTNATASVMQPITSGMIGATVSIEYDDTWTDLHKQVVFKGPCGTVNAEGNTIPPEVLRFFGFELKVGIYGYSGDGSVAIPTVWASLGMIQPGADPEGDKTADPTLPVWARMQNQIGNLDSLETQAKESLVAAINELQAAGVDETEIQRIIGEYLEENEVGGKEIPVFDLTAMGLSDIGGGGLLECDTTKLMNALSQGPIRLQCICSGVPVSGTFAGYEVNMGGTGYLVNIIFPVEGMRIIAILVAHGQIAALCANLLTQ